MQHCWCNFSHVHIQLHEFFTWCNLNILGQVLRYIFTVLRISVLMILARDAVAPSIYIHILIKRHNANWLRARRCQNVWRTVTRDDSKCWQFVMPGSHVLFHIPPFECHNANQLRMSFSQEVKSMVAMVTDSSPFPHVAWIALSMILGQTLWDHNNCWCHSRTHGAVEFLWQNLSISALSLLAQNVPYMLHCKLDKHPWVWHTVHMLVDYDYSLYYIKKWFWEVCKGEGWVIVYGSMPQANC
jgi:hypothetical protein